MAVVTFLLPNQPYPLSMNLPPMFLPLTCMKAVTVKLIDQSHACRKLRNPHGGYKREPCALHFGHLAEFIAVSACFVWEDARVRLRLLWFSQVRLTVSQWPDPVPPRGHAKGLAECWSLLSGSPLVRVEGKLPPWSRTICLGSVRVPPLILPQ